MKKILVPVVFWVISFTSCNQTSVRIGVDADPFVSTGSPVAMQLSLNGKLKKAGDENRLVLSDPSGRQNPIPVQKSGNGDCFVFILPGGTVDEYVPEETEQPADNKVRIMLDGSTGQYMFGESGNPVLQYNYSTVYEKDVIRVDDTESTRLVFSEVSGIYLDEFLKENPSSRRDSLYTSSIYSIPRSDYIHPLYGLNGEMLTRDWPDGGHPHHRGIFWAWPEVELGSQRGDLYALQRVFARPTGKVAITEGPVFAQLVAENLWMWENEKPIVRETASIRVYRRTEDSRIIDIAIKLDALEDSITIATRGTDSYGSFNLRMQTPDSQDISYYTDEKGAVPLRSWADFSGVFRGDRSPSGIMVLQYMKNPEYPGPWQKYPELSWIQPVFPSHGTRYPVTMGNPLILRFRLVVHTGSKPGRDISEKRWDAFNSTLTPLYMFSSKD